MHIRKSCKFNFKNYKSLYIYYLKEINKFSKYQVNLISVISDDTSITLCYIFLEYAKSSTQYWIILSLFKVLLSM